MSIALLNLVRTIPARSLGSTLVLALMALAVVGCPEYQEPTTLPPMVTITSSSSQATNDSIISVIVSFTAEVTGFDVTDLVVGNGAIGNFAGSGTDYSFDLVPSSDGVVTVDIPEGVVEDASGNLNTPAPQFRLNYDGTNPRVVLTSVFPQLCNSPTITVYATFTEAVTDFDASDISVGNGSVLSLVGSAASYSFDVVPASDGLGDGRRAGGVSHRRRGQRQRRFEYADPHLRRNGPDRRALHNGWQSDHDDAHSRHRNLLGRGYGI